jgi:hypothetical protein
VAEPAAGRARARAGAIGVADCGVHRNGQR